MTRAAATTAALLSPCAIAYWLGTRRVVPSVTEIVEHTGCSRAAAYRWRAFALEGDCSRERGKRSLPPATTAALASHRHQRSRFVRAGAADRVVAALTLCAASERQLSTMLALPPSTTQTAIRMLHVRGVIRPAGHAEHRPMSRARGGAITWTLSNAALQPPSADVDVGERV